MDNKTLEVINELRKTLNISISDAKNLVNEYSTDVDMCIKQYHQHRINKLCRLTACDKQTVQTYYQSHHCNFDKALKKIQLLCWVLSIEHGFSTNKPISKIGYILYAGCEPESPYAHQDKHIFITADDFSYVLPAFLAVFPLTKPIEQHHFNHCFDNNFENALCRKIIDNIAEIKTDDINIERFIRELITWMTSKLGYADWITVEGTL